MKDMIRHQNREFARGWLLLLVPMFCSAQTITVDTTEIERSFPSGAVSAVALVLPVVSGPVQAEVKTTSGGNWLLLDAEGVTTQGLRLSLDPAGLPNGAFRSEVKISEGTRVRSVQFTMMIGETDPRFNAAGIVNSASYRSGAISPGEIVVLFGSRIGPPLLYGAQLRDRRLVAKLAGSRVWFDDIAAPLIYASTNQIAAIVPFEVAGRERVDVKVENMVLRTAAIAIPVKPVTPGIFTANSSGSGQAAALNHDSSINSAANPASKGSIVVLYATGTGRLNLTVPTGALIDAAPYPIPSTSAVVTIDGKPAEVLYYGAAPGLVAGVTQLNVRVPIDARSGIVAVQLQMQQEASQPDVTIQVQ